MTKEKGGSTDATQLCLKAPLVGSRFKSLKSRVVLPRIDGLRIALRVGGITRGWLILATAVLKQSGLSKRSSAQSKALCESQAREARPNMPARQWRQRAPSQRG